MGPEAEEAEVTFLTRDGREVVVGNLTEVEVVSAQKELEEKEPKKTHWEENGFLDDIARICNDLEVENEQFLFSAEIRQIIELVNNAKDIASFDRYSNDEIQNFIHTLRQRVPQVEREVMSFMGQLNNARTVQVETIDYI